MEIEINNTTKQRLNLQRLKKIAKFFLKKYKLTGAILSIAIIGDEPMRHLNQVYRHQNKPTDVLSFTKLNEIIINYDQIKRQAAELGNAPAAELDFILVHGLLHLAGYDDNTELKRLRMIKLGHEFLAKFPRK